MSESKEATRLAPTMFEARLLLQLAEAASDCSRDLSTPVLISAYTEAEKLSDSHSSDAKQDDSAAVRIRRQIRKRVQEKVIKDLSAGSRDAAFPSRLATAVTLLSKTEKYEEDRVHLWAMYENVVTGYLGIGRKESAYELFRGASDDQQTFPYRIAAVFLTSKPTVDLSAEIVSKTAWAIAEGRVIHEDDLAAVSKALANMSQGVASESLVKYMRVASSASNGSQILTTYNNVREMLMRISPSDGQSFPVRQMEVVATKANNSDEDKEDKNVKVLDDVKDAAIHGNQNDVLQKVASISDNRLRVAILSSAVMSLEADGKTDKAAAVKGALTGMIASDVEANPADYLLRAKRTAANEAEITSAVLDSLNVAEKLLQVGAADYQKETDEDGRARAFEKLNQEAVAVYKIAGETDLLPALSSALRVSGPQRADVFSALLQGACETYARNKER